MNVAFRPLGKRDREWLLARDVRHVPSADESRYFGRGSVVTLDGLIVLALDRRGAVIYQDGSAAIPDLIRAHKRVGAALGNLTYEDLERVRRKGKPRYTAGDFLAETAQ